MHKVALHFTISSVGTREMAMGGRDIDPRMGARARDSAGSLDLQVLEISER